MAMLRHCMAWAEGEGRRDLLEMWDVTSDVTSFSGDDDDWWNSLPGLAEVPDGTHFDIVGDDRHLPRVDGPPIAVA